MSERRSPEKYPLGEGITPREGRVGRVYKAGTATVSRRPVLWVALALFLAYLPGRLFLPLTLYLPLLVALAGYAVLWFAVRPRLARGLYRLIAGLYTVQLLVTFGQYELFVALGTGGFFFFKNDAPIYHASGLAVADAWLRGEMPVLPGLAYTADFSLLLGALYVLFGPHLLVAGVFNALLLGGLIYASWSLCRSVGIGQRPALWASGLIGLWPSALLYAGQPFKERLSATLVMTCLALLAFALSRLRVSPRFWLTLAAVLFLGFALSRLRPYLGIFLLFATVPVGIAALLFYLAKQHYRRAGIVAAVVFVAVAGVTGARFLSPILLLTDGEPPLKTPAAQTEPGAGDVSQILRGDVSGLSFARQSFAVGGSAVEPELGFTDPADVGENLPRLVAWALFAPFPWEWGVPGPTTGLFKSLVVPEVMLIYLIFPLGLWGALRMVRRPTPARLLLVVFAVSSTIVLSFMIANLGTLNRLRVAFIFPWIVLAFAAGPGELISRTLEGWLASVRQLLSSLRVKMAGF